MAMLEWVCCVKPNPPQWEGPDLSFINPVRCKIVREHICISPRTIELLAPLTVPGLGSTIWIRA